MSITATDRPRINVSEATRLYDLAATTLPYIPDTIDTIENDPVVNKPKHYQTRFGFETIDVMAAFTEDLKGMQAIDTAQVIKYITRWSKKDGLRDLKKARYYLEHLISVVEGGDVGDDNE